MRDDKGVRSIWEPKKRVLVTFGFQCSVDISLQMTSSAESSSGGGGAAALGQSQPLDYTWPRPPQLPAAAASEAPPAQVLRFQTVLPWNAWYILRQSRTLIGHNELPMWWKETLHSSAWQATNLPCRAGFFFTDIFYGQTAATGGEATHILSHPDPALCFVAPLSLLYSLSNHWVIRVILSQPAAKSSD